MAGLKFFHLGLLVGREHLKQFGVNAGLLYSQFGKGLTLLRRDRAHLGFILSSFFILPELLMSLVELLHKRLQSGVLLSYNCLHLSLLGIAQVEVVGEESHHMIAESKFMMVHGRSLGIRRLRLGHRSGKYNSHRGDQ